MSKNRSIKTDAFVLYSSFYGPISPLSDEQLGRLFRALFKWQLSEETEVDSDIIMPYRFFVNQFEIDDAKYLAKCEKSRKSINKRWQEIRTNTNEYERIGTNRNDTYNNNENDNDNDNNNEKEKDNSKDNEITVHSPNVKKSSFSPPSLEEIKKYSAEQNATTASAESFFDYYSASGWKLSNGNPVKDWQSAFRNWVRRSKYNAPRHPAPSSRIEIPAADDSEFQNTIF